MARPAQSAWSGTPLPRGRHGLETAEVRESQRERLLRAMLELIGERGYAMTTVPEVVARARTARNAFYALWPDKISCFLELVEGQMRELWAAITAAADAPAWRDAIHGGTAAYLGFWEARPAFARAFLVEHTTAGGAAIAQRAEEFARWERLYADLGARARREEPDLPPLPVLAPRLLVAGVVEILAKEVREGRGDQLTRLTDDLATLNVAVLTGAAARSS